MNLLLDTHTLLWWLEASPRLGKKALGKIASPDNVIWVSAVVPWELGIKIALNRLDAQPDFVDGLLAEIERYGFRQLPVSLEHGLEAAVLPLHHRDPFDRMLIIQARAEGHTIVTADRRFSLYDVPLLAADA